jgi:hypothetical protein
MIGLVAAGCDFTVPISQQHTVAVDGAVLGLWETQSDGGKVERLLVLKLSETEYVVQYPLGADAMLFRGYPVKVGDQTLVQLQVLGTVKGQMPDKNAKPYQIAAYRTKEDTLRVKLLDPRSVGENLHSTDTLRAAVVEALPDSRSFREEMRFKRVPAKDAPPTNPGQ